jgi:hypothetical protein
MVPAAGVFQSTQTVKTIQTVPAARPAVRHQVVASHHATVHHVAAAASSRPLYNYVGLTPSSRRLQLPRQGKCSISRVNFCVWKGVQADSGVWCLSRKMDGTSILSMNWANPRGLGSTGPATSGRKIGTKAQSIRPTE